MPRICKSRSGRHHRTKEAEDGFQAQHGDRTELSPRSIHRGVDGKEGRVGPGGSGPRDRAGPGHFDARFVGNGVRFSRRSGAGHKAQRRPGADRRVGRPALPSLGRCRLLRLCGVAGRAHSGESLTAAKLPQKASDVQPTIRIRPEKCFDIFVWKDIVFPELCM